MSNIIDILDWDSNFFGIKVCRITGAISNNEELTSVFRKLKELDVDLGYYSSVLPLNEYNFSELYNINLVDKKTTYLKEINQKATSCISVTPYKSDYPDAKLFELAIESGIYSRFNIDKNIGRIKYEELYKEWIINSVNKKLAKEVLIYNDNGNIKGFITLGGNDSIADIGIIAVDSDYRGKGIGKSLMYSAEEWFAKKNYKNIQVITQLDNLPACRLYESCGYRINKVEYFYHVWKKNDQ